MESDERTTFIARRELTARVEHHIHRSPVGWVAGDWKRKCAAPPHCLAVAAILRVKQQLLLRIVEKAIRPTEIKPLRGAVHRLGRTSGILLSGKLLRPQYVQLVPAVHHDIERAVVPCDRWLLAKSGYKFLPIRLFLVQLVLVKLPDAAMRLQQRTRV